MDKFTINLIREGVMDMFQEVIKEAEKKYDHQSLSRQDTARILLRARCLQPIGRIK